MKRNTPSIKRFNNIHNPNRIRRPGSERASRIRKYSNQHMLLHVKRTRVKRHHFRPEPGESELRRRQNRRHEVTDRKRRDLNGDESDDERLCSVREELVEEGED